MTKFDSLLQIILEDTETSKDLPPFIRKKQRESKNTKGEKNESKPKQAAPEKVKKTNEPNKGTESVKERPANSPMQQDSHKKVEKKEYLVMDKSGNKIGSFAGTTKKSNYRCDKTGSASNFEKGLQKLLKELQSSKCCRMEKGKIYVTDKKGFESFCAGDVGEESDSSPSPSTKSGEKSSFIYY